MGQFQMAPSSLNVAGLPLTSSGSHLVPNPCPACDAVSGTQCLVTGPRLSLQASEPSQAEVSMVSSCLLGPCATLVVVTRERLNVVTRGEPWLPWRGAGPQ